jgi:pyruvate formate lyase activating enzyme
VVTRVKILTPLFDIDDPRIFEPTPPPVHAAIVESGSSWPAVRALTILLSGCSWSCAYCRDPEHRAQTGALASVDELLGKIAQMGRSIDGVVVSGGEPIESPALTAILRGIRDLGLATRLDTNGSRPEMLESLLGQNLLDFVALDVKTTPERYDRVAGSQDAWERVERSISAILHSGVDHEFRTTCYPFGVSCADLPSIAARLSGGKRFVLQQFVPVRTLDPGAGSATPWSADELRRAAIRCSVHLPTFVRGV